MKAYLISTVLVALVTTASFSQFEKGWYYDKNGQKNAGLIKHKYGARTFSDKPDNSIVFKKDQQAEKVSLTIDDISSFVIKGDSFMILKNFSINALVTYPADFVRVVKTGKINLYQHYTTTPSQYGASAALTWLITKQYITKPLFKKEFNNTYAELFGECPELVSKIESKKLKFDDLEKIVEEYNQFTSQKK